MHQQVPCTRKKMISLGSWLIACCKLAPTLARQMWRHNYVIDRNEYLIFTLLESINPWVYALQFLFRKTNNSWRYERKWEWVFFLNTVYKAVWIHLNEHFNNSFNSSQLKHTQLDASETSSHNVISLLCCELSHYQCHMIKHIGNFIGDFSLLFWLPGAEW